MAGRLSEDRRETIKRPHVTLDFTLNLQSGLRGVDPEEKPALYAFLLVELDKLAERVLREARQILDAASTLAAKLDSELNGEDVAKHIGCSRATLDNRGSAMYLRVQLTSTRPLLQSVMYRHVKELLDFFDEHVIATIEAAEHNERSTKNLGATALAVLAALPGSGEPQLGDRI